MTEQSISLHMQSFFRVNGYYVIRSALNEGVRRDLFSRLDEFLGHQQQSASTHRIENVIRQLDLAPALAAAEPLRLVLRELLGGEGIVAIVNRHNHITIDFGNGHRGSRFHRDALSWSRSYVTAVALLSAPDAAASWPCLLPGSHLWPLAGPTNGGGFWLDEDEAAHLATQALPVPMAPGDVLLMDPMVFHRGGIGLETAARVTLTLAFRSTDELLAHGAENETLILGAANYRGQGWWLE